MCLKFTHFKILHHKVFPGTACLGPCLWGKWGEKAACLRGRCTCPVQVGQFFFFRAVIIWRKLGLFDQSRDFVLFPGSWYPGYSRSLFFMMKLITMSGKAAIVGMEFKKPWCIFGVEVLESATWFLMLGGGEKHGKNYWQYIYMHGESGESNLHQLTESSEILMNLIFFQIIYAKKSAPFHFR